MSDRQQVLVLYLATSALDAAVVGWSGYDGTGAHVTHRPGTATSRRTRRAWTRCSDGWRLFQASQLIPPYPGHEYDVSFLKHEFFFEKLS